MWIEKTHGNDKHIELFLSWYPTAKIIHIIRDPYDNFSSYRKKMEKNGAVVDAVSFCVEWTLSIDRVLKAYKKYPQQVHILQFEKLLQSPSSELLKICSFLNISYDTIIQAPTTYGVDWTGNSQLDKKFNKISKKPIGSHKQNIMSSHDIDIIATMVKRYSSFLYWSYPVRSALLLKKLSLKKLMITFSIKFNFFMSLRVIHRVIKLIKLN